MSGNNFFRKKSLLLYIIIIGVTCCFFYFEKQKRNPPIQELSSKEKFNSASTEISNTNFFYDFETLDGISGTDNIKITTAHSGTKACDLSAGQEYGPSIIKTINDVSSDSLKQVGASIWIYPLTDNPNTVLTLSIMNDKNESVFWDGKSTENNHFQKNKWTKLNAVFRLPTNKFSLNDKIYINFWNKGKEKVIIDDLEIVYGETAERKGYSTTIDANAINEKRFVQDKNKPPFPTIYFEKQEIKNNNGTFITSDKKNSLADFSPNDFYLVGNFTGNKNNLDEIVCIKNGKASLFAYSTESGQFQLIWQSTINSDSLWNTTNQFYAGDYNTDNKQNVLIVNEKNGTYKTLDFSGKEWISILKGKEKEIYLKEKLTTKNELKTMNKNIFSNNDILFKGNFYKNSTTEFLKLNTDWRFDLKLIEKQVEDFTILGNIDFKGYPNDYNPKYFEFVKIVAGNFIDSKKTSLLIMMRNCADDTFKGVHCNQFENISSLPNSTQLYSIESKK